ncbi:murein DD-endopeptidase MepM/ murein hydrolase activator NlpD [Streptomyces sp. V3I7]|nr:murein DD-endopeptidase MepM/ murein hydrolase activator NlpD [Streptomyces sp. V3I7]
MNDRHASGTMTTPAPASEADSAHYASHGGQEAHYGDFTGYGAYDTGTYTTDPHATAYGNDPLFGTPAGDGHATGAYGTGTYDTSAYDTGTYDTGAWTTGAHPTADYDPYATQQQTVYHGGGYDTGAWTVPPQAAGADATGQWDASAWLQPDPSALAEPAPQQSWDWGTQTFDTGAYDATQWNSDGTLPEQRTEPFDPQSTGAFEQLPHHEAPFEHHPYEEHSSEQTPYEQTPYEQDSFADGAPGAGEVGATSAMPAVTPLLEDQEEVTPVPSTRAGARGASRARRRTPAKRSALLTVAVPSACVMGVAGIAAASVGGMTDDTSETAAAAPDVHEVKPSAANNRLDSQLEGISAGVDDFADRASRTQERIDLKAQQVAEQKRAAEEAARKERLRPKFALPVAQHGLSALYGQSGVNWMSLHTGIDFPVSYGTSVMAATDGTVSTKWNSAYGNMLVLTAKDGTETWYCHLSSYRVSSGTPVKAGDPIAFSGNSGNSTGPHLHFEVRPAGGSAIDPLPWLRSHGLDPN